MITGTFIELACKDKSCAPPPVGTGGSQPSGSSGRSEMGEQMTSIIANHGSNPAWSVTNKLGLVVGMTGANPKAENHLEMAVRSSAAHEIGKMIDADRGADIGLIKDPYFVQNAVLEILMDRDRMSNKDRRTDDPVNFHRNYNFAERVQNALSSGDIDKVKALLAEKGISPGEVIAYGLIMEWNTFESANVHRMRVRAESLLPMNGEQAPLRTHPPSGEPLPDSILDAFIGAVYERTQAALRAAGVEEVTVARGVTGGTGDRQPIGWEETDVRLRSLSSYTGSPSLALKFAGFERVVGTVIVTKVPAKYVFSIPLTGIGTTYEAEVVVLGGQYRSEILSSMARTVDKDAINTKVDA